MKPLLRLALTALAFAAGGFAAESPALDWPEITSTAKPWSRWWWLGNIGTKQDFTTEMENYARAGLGGLEITPIYGVRGQEERFRPYLSREWMELLDHVLDEAERLGLGIDMSTGTGWPFGGPWVTPEMASRHVVTKTYPVRGGERLADAVTATEQPVVRVAGPRRVTIGELKDPVTANPNLQDLALDQVRFPRPLPLQALIAYSESGDKADLTGRVDAAGRLDWTAPGAGTWTLYAVFAGWHGKQVERAGPGGEGDAIDHFSSAALARYLERFDEAFRGHRAQRLRAYFNDSYEVDDAAGEANWTPRFFEEFKRRRGYDLRDELPAFTGRDTPGKNARVLADHRETISDLLLEEFTVPWAQWARKHRGIIRNQAHGSPANIIDLYAASDIPETEGTNIIGMKLASSAAHVTGKRLTSAETATWLDEHWLSTLGDIKRRVDLMFLGGVNHNCYHGTVFSPPGEPWPGHHFYASVELDPSNAIWADADVLNAYVARAQAFLQSGEPANDLLLYYPIHDTWAQRGDGAMPHFGGGSRPGGHGIAQELFDRGYTFDFISDRLVAELEYRDGTLRRGQGGARYRAIVVPEVKHMPPATLGKLARLAEAGASVIFHKSIPDDVPGFGDLESRRAALRGHAEAVRSRASVSLDFEPVFRHLKIDRETLVDRGLQFVRRRHDRGHLYFLVNRGPQPFDGWITLATPAASAALFDPATGRRGVALQRQAADGRLEFRLHLAPNETRIVKTFSDERIEGAPFVPVTPGAPRPLHGRWSLRFVRGGPVLPPAAETSELRSWTEFAGGAGKAFAGTAVYTLTFTREDAPADCVLDLGGVADSARVRLNGRELGALIDPPWRVLVPRDALRRGANTLEVAVTNLSANRIANLDRRDPGWKKFYNINYPARLPANRGPDGNFSAAKWPPRPSGLLGPVTLAPLRSDASAPR